MNERIAIIFLCEEAASLFKGGQHLPRFGGAGLNMYLLARELQKDERFDVSFVFNVNPAHAYVDVSCLEGAGVRILSRKVLVENPIKRGVRKVAHIFGKTVHIPSVPQMNHAIYEGLPKRRIVFASMKYHLYDLLAESKVASAKSVLRVAAEPDVEMITNDGKTPNLALETYKEVDQMVVQTEVQKEKLFAAGVESVVIPKGFSAQNFDASLEKDIDFLWVASCQPVYQPWKFIDLAKVLPEYSFQMLAPPGNVQLLDYLRRASNELENLSLIDRQISFEDSQELFNRAKIFAFTKEYGSEPTSTIMQAFSGGAAVLSSGLDIDDGLFDEHNCWVRTDGSFEDFVSAASGMIEDCTAREQYVQKSRQLLQERYSPQRAARSYADLFVKLVG